MNEPVSTKKLILCSIAGTLLAGLVIRIVEMVIAGIVFGLMMSRNLSTDKGERILESLPHTEKVPMKPIIYTPPTIGVAPICSAYALAAGWTVNGSVCVPPIKQQTQTVKPEQPPIKYDYYTVKP